MSIKRIEPGKRMSGAVVHGNTVYLAGQVGEGTSVPNRASLRWLKSIAFWLWLDQTSPRCSRPSSTSPTCPHSAK